MRIAIVTGASSGMGMEMVRQIPYFYKNLDEIWVIARRRERLFSLAKQVILPLRIFEGDLLNEDVYKRVEEDLKKIHPDVRMLVNAAGFGKNGAFSDIAQKNRDVQLEMIDINCRALTQMTAVCLPYIGKEGRIINLASAAAFCPQPLFAVYAATKSYVYSFSKALTAELQDRQIYVTAVCPGPVDTEFFNISGAISNPLKKCCMADPMLVVHKALRDARNKKEVSVYGISMKLSRLAAKVLPHKWLIQFLQITAHGVRRT